MTTNGLLETGQAALVLRVSPFRVRQLADDGTLPVAIRTATGRRLFEPGAVEQLRRQRDQCTAGATGESRSPESRAA